VLFYRAALPLSRQTLTFVSGIIRRHRKSIGSRWRKLNPGQQALLVLAYLRKGETFAELAAGFAVGTTTAWRYAEETVALLAATAPKLRRAVRDATKAGYAYVVLDGTLIPIDRVAADRPFYSGKHKRHGMNLQVIASPRGELLWVSGPLPGAVHDKKAEWIWGVLDELEKAGLVTLADKGYQGSAHPASAQTPSSRPGASSASSAAAPGEPASSPRPSTLWRFTQHKEDGKGSVRTCQAGAVTITQSAALSGVAAVQAVGPCGAGRSYGLVGRLLAVIEGRSRRAAAASCGLGRCTTAARRTR
jgi:hypothetical protein